MPIGSAYIILETNGKALLGCTFDPPLPDGTEIHWSACPLQTEQKVKIWGCDPHPLSNSPVIAATPPPDASDAAEAAWEDNQQLETGADRCPPRE